VELFYFVCRMKLVLRLDVGRWSRILRVWEIVKNRDLTPDDIVSSVVAVGALVLDALLPAYVRKKAHYYAESFFAAVAALSGSKPRQRTKTGE
jgi:hypothetical protein